MRDNEGLRLKPRFYANLIILPVSDKFNKNTYRKHWGLE